MGSCLTADDKMQGIAKLMLAVEHSSGSTSVLGGEMFGNQSRATILNAASRPSLPGPGEAANQNLPPQSHRLDLTHAITQLSKIPVLRRYPGEFRWCFARSMQPGHPETNSPHQLIPSLFRRFQIWEYETPKPNEPDFNGFLSGRKSKIQEPAT